MTKPDDIAQFIEHLRTECDDMKVGLAAALQVNQAAISRFENRENIQISTLAQIIEAMGGELELRASFKDFEARIEPAGRRKAVMSKPMSSAVQESLRAVDADPAQENRCREAGILIVLNEVCGSQSLA